MKKFIVPLITVLALTFSTAIVAHTDVDINLGYPSVYIGPPPPPPPRYVYPYPYWYDPYYPYDNEWDYKHHHHHYHHRREWRHDGYRD